ncbi:MAG TPA: hypothetical protein VGQ99_18170 [Tepidisphaeraceae bacterium]|jgi:Arc/MetJ-type ribon-helix-helix transcriptional regulator|nr:hypothetical protein [Tepidisphaeraceae bacterium]
MRLNLKPATEQLIRQKVSSGEYSTPADVVEAALATLEQQTRFDFAPGELERLIAEGEESIKKFGTLDGPSAFKRRRRRRALARRKK